jgi:hypothetical protein
MELNKLNNSINFLMAHEKQIKLGLYIVWETFCGKTTRFRANSTPELIYDLLKATLKEIWELIQRRKK